MEQATYPVQFSVDYPDRPVLATWVIRSENRRLSDFDCTCMVVMKSTWLQLRG
jgi:hypothetical protein